MRTVAAGIVALLAGFVGVGGAGGVVPAPNAALRAAVPGDPFDLELVIDGSGSIDPPDFDLARLFSKRVVQSCLFHENAQAGVIQFSDAAQVEAPLTGEVSLLTDALDLMGQLQESTATAEAIDAAQAQLAAGRPGVAKFMIVLTDGNPNNTAAAVTSATAAKSAGTRVFAIGVGSVSEDVLNDIASDPDTDNVFAVSDFASLESTLAAVVGAACETTPVTPGRYNALDNPARLLDTRYGPGPIGHVAANAVVELQVAGAAGVPADASGVLLNTTVTRTAGAGFVTVWGCGSPRPTVSNLNYAVDDEVANLVATKIGVGGKVCLSPGVAGADLVVDVSGYIANTGSLYNPIEPSRFADTRTTGKVGAETTFALTVAGIGAVPPSATAVVLNATVTNPDGFGFVTVWPCGLPRPLASNVNYAPGENVPNLVAVRVGAGQVCFSGNRTTDLAIDVMGWFGATGGAYEPVFPTRVVDSRDGTGPGFDVGPLDPGEVRSLRVTDPGGSAPGLGGTPPTATGVILNVTAVAPRGAGYLSLWPCGGTPPYVSNVNYVTQQTVPNLVAVKLNAQGRVCYSSFANSHAVIDLVGFFSPAT